MRIITVLLAVLAIPVIIIDWKSALFGLLAMVFAWILGEPKIVGRLFVLFARWASKQPRRQMKLFDSDGFAYAVMGGSILGILFLVAWNHFPM